MELLTNAEMNAADAAAAASGIASLDLMESAGGAVASAAATLAETRRRDERAPRIRIACGPGNNGGDGFVAARILAEKGFDVRVGLLGEEASLKGDALAMRRLWTGAIERLPDALFADADVIIDALFGAGLTRPLSGEAAAVVDAINGARGTGSLVLAVDVPSGLSGTTGAAEGPVVVADETVTFFRLKPGHLLYPGRRLCGVVTLAAIPIPEAVLAPIAPRTFSNGPDLWRSHFPVLDAEAHKYTRGHAVVVSGPAECTGAARLGACAALRMGAGLVTIIGSPAATAVNAAQTTAVMVRVATGAEGIAEFLADTRRNVVLIGPGAGTGEGTARAVHAVLASQAAAVLDADALTAFTETADGSDKTSAGSFGFVTRRTSERETPESLFAAIKGRSQPVVLTPHEGEFKRLFGTMQTDKLARARHAAASSGAVVILKGPDTVVAAPDGKAAINANAPPWLATAGSGDVLAGFVTGLLAQRMPVFEAACAAVWLHGEAAQRFGRGLIAEDLSEMLPTVLQQMTLA